MRIFILSALCLCLLGIIYQGTAVHATPLVIEDVGPTFRASVSSGGGQSNSSSYKPAVSADGRYIAFSSDASNLVSDDTNNFRDIFVHDRETNTTERISVRTGGEQSNSNSFAPAISGDGRIVVYHSLASNLVDGDTNNRMDVFAYDRQTGQTGLMSVVLSGTANDHSQDADISADGRYVVFTSSASNLVGGDNNGKGDIFRWDRLALQMLRISVDSNGAEANDHSSSAAVSGDGQRIVFASSAGNLVAGDGNNAADIFLRDTGTNLTTRVSITDGGGEANGTSWDPDISAGGQHIVFVSLATNLVTGDANGYADVFLRNTGTSHTYIISIATDGTQADDWCEEPSVSGDGRYVAFVSSSSALSPGTSPDLRKLLIRDRTNSVLLLGSVSSEGLIGNDDSATPVLASDSPYVVFTSLATNLVTNDTNNAPDAFIHDYVGPPTFHVDHTLGAPGSYFVFSGANWEANGTAVVHANGVTLGNVATDANGNVNFQIITDGSTQQGVYIISIAQGSTQLSRTITVWAGAPLHPGSGTSFALPNGIALDEFTYLPVIRR